MKTLLWILIVCLWTSAHAVESHVGLELLPKERRPFRPTFADPREIRMSLGFEGDSKINAAIGNYFSIFSIRPAEDPHWYLHFGLEGAGFFTMRQASSRFPLETADGLIGVYVEGRNGQGLWQVRYTHVSAHLADGSTGSAIPYSRETLSARAAWVPFEELQLYGGAHYLTNSIPILDPWGLQWGGSYFLSLGDTKIIPFCAADFKWKQGSAANPSFNLQFGAALNNPPEAYRSFRFFYSYYTGVDPRGQFYDRIYTAHSIGIEMQI